MYAYVARKDGAKAVVAASLIRGLRPSSETDLALGKNKMIYWREKREVGELEDYFPGDFVELAESKEDIARKPLRRRMRFPEHVFDDVLKAAPSRKNCWRNAAAAIGWPVSFKSETRRYDASDVLSSVVRVQWLSVDVTDYCWEPGDIRCCTQGDPGTQHHLSNFVESRLPE
ncbi:hypothetical protein MRX96_018799 [Rhipicephalus microplus]